MSRLTVEREREIYSATLQLVATRGFASTTMDAIADEAHCSKATLYRQWESKARLVVEAMHTLKPEPATLPDTGTFVGDLHALVEQRFSHVLDAGLLIMAILHAAMQDDELRSALESRFHTADRRGEVEQLVDRAVARGEIVGELDVLTYLPLVFLAPVVLQPLLGDKAPDAAAMNDYLDATLIPLLGLNVG